MSNMRLLVLSAAAVLALAGCGNEKRTESTSGTTTASTGMSMNDAPKDPSSRVSFVAPKDGSTVGPRFTARVKLTDFVIDVKAVGKSPVPGRGHLHFRLDGGRFDIPEHSGENGKLAKQLGVEGKYSPAGTPEITYEKIPPGKHKLEVYLANNNHTLTGVEAEVEFTVK
jgi:hypothetical protein